MRYEVFTPRPRCVVDVAVFETCRALLDVMESNLAVVCPEVDPVKCRSEFQPIVRAVGVDVEDVLVSNHVYIDLVKRLQDILIPLALNLVLPEPVRPDGVHGVA